MLTVLLPEKIKHQNRDLKDGCVEILCNDVSVVKRAFRCFFSLQTCRQILDALPIHGIWQKEMYSFMSILWYRDCRSCRIVLDVLVTSSNPLLRNTSVTMGVPCVV